MKEKIQIAQLFLFIFLYFIHLSSFVYKTLIPRSCGDNDTRVYNRIGWHADGASWHEADAVTTPRVEKLFLYLQLSLFYLSLLCTLCTTKEDILFYNHRK